MHRFFVPAENITEDIACIDKNEARHIRKVLRLRTGDTVSIFDGSGREYHAELLVQGADRLCARIYKTVTRDEAGSFKLTLVQGIAKGDKMDTIIQKAVEIGVYDIIPVRCEHSVVRLEGDKALKKTERWQHIALEACKQCHRNLIPKVHPLSDISDVFAMVGEDIGIMLYEKEEVTGFKQLLRDKQGEAAGKKVYVFIGPEGGFSTDEVSKAEENGIYFASLGPRILRTETAGIVASGIIMYEYGDLG